MLHVYNYCTTRSIPVSGGFGNLTKIDIDHRRPLTKISTIDASNTSHCEYSRRQVHSHSGALSKSARQQWHQSMVPPRAAPERLALRSALSDQLAPDAYRHRLALFSRNPACTLALPLQASKPQSQQQNAGVYRPSGARGSDSARHSHIASCKEDSASSSGIPRGIHRTPTLAHRTSANAPRRRAVPTEMALPESPALALKTGEMTTLVKEGSVPPTPGGTAQSSVDEKSAKYD